jgi:hypothetical protein
MAENVEDALSQEAKVVAEAAPIAAEPPVVKAEETPAKKKKSPVMTIILVIVGLLVACCACGAFGFYYLYNSVQNGPQATALKEMYTALSDAKPTQVQAVADTQLFADLYKKNANGEAMADQFLGNVVKIVITNVSVENDYAKIEYTMLVNRNQSLFTSLNYAELKKVGEKWIVVYIGDKADQTETPTQTTDDF